jgi:hypothetical protein
MPPAARWCFRVGALLAAGVALLHAALPFVAPEWYADFGASELAVAKRTGARWPDALTLALAAVFAGWAYAARSRSGTLRSPSSRSRSASRSASERGARGPPCAAGRRANESLRLAERATAPRGGTDHAARSAAELRR